MECAVLTSGWVGDKKKRLSVKKSLYGGIILLIIS